MDAPSPLHIAMFPWFAMGHLTPYLHFSNKLAIRGHKISFFIPKNTLNKLQHLNLHPNLITFVPINVPHVNGLPHDAQTTSDVPFSLVPLIATAMDQTEKDIEPLLKKIKPQIVFFDFQYWLPSLTKNLGIKSLQYIILSPISTAYLGSLQKLSQGRDLTEVDLVKPPSGFPDSRIKFHSHELRFLVSIRKIVFGSGVFLFDRFHIGTTSADAVGFKGCNEIDEPYADYIETVFAKPVLLSGPLLPEPPKTTLDGKWDSWLKGFKNALKRPNGFDSIEEAIPEGFNERVKGKGIVYGSWIQQQLILEHPSVGCFITHCRAASITEGLVNTCQLVLLPRIGSDHIMNARMMSDKFKVGVDVEKGEEDGLFTIIMNLANLVCF
ncbi:cyanidin 3-O-galactoside 2''-O-xylosyltransferase FGGT1 [Trifolium repens]|nr:cyanidin 3-O-galactoside 2''-O-xylosyltransferase FGGT1 [Trifolium repens]